MAHGQHARRGQSPATPIPRLESNDPSHGDMRIGMPASEDWPCVLLCGMRRHRDHPYRRKDRASNARVLIGVLHDIFVHRVSHIHRVAPQGGRVRNDDSRTISKQVNQCSTPHRRSPCRRRKSRDPRALFLRIRRESVERIRVLDNRAPMPPSEKHAFQCDETNTASSNASGIAKLSRMRLVSAAGVKPKRRLNSRLNCDALVYPTA